MIGNILHVLKILGINYKKVNKGAPKKGEIPNIDIDMVEFNIKQLEGLILTNDQIDAGPDEIKILMDFYQKVILIKFRPLNITVQLTILYLKHIYQG